MFAQEVVEITEELAEPIDNYEVGIKHCVDAKDEEWRWPDGEYPTRTLTVERMYDYEPEIPRSRWFIKKTWTTIMSDGQSFVTTDYSQEAPLVNNFCNQDVHYNKIALSGMHDWNYSHDSYGKVTAYVYRKGNHAWGLPVMAFIYGWVWDPIWRNDVMYQNPIRGYEDHQYVLLGPVSSGANVAQWSPDFVRNTEFTGNGVATLWYEPD
jgi:hypothetical protein